MVAKSSLYFHHIKEEAQSFSELQSTNPPTQSSRLKVIALREKFPAFRRDFEVTAHDSLLKTGLAEWPFWMTPMVNFHSLSEWITPHHKISFLLQLHCVLAHLLFHLHTRG